MWMKKSLQFALLAVAAVAVVAEPPAYGTSTFATGFRPAGHVGYQGGYQPGYQGGFLGGYQGGYQGAYQGGYQGGYRGKYQGGYDEGAPQPFSFQYEVKDPQSGNDYGHQATSDGRNVQGEYQVLLPDGRRQIVKYVADDNGYNADVRYEGEARQYQGSGYAGFPSGGYVGNGGYTGIGGYTGQAGYVGPKVGYGAFTTQKAVYGGFTR